MALAEKGDFSGTDTLLDALGSTNREVRLRAANSCGRIGLSASLEPLCKMATSNPASENRNEAIFALVGVGRPAAVPALIQALNDTDQERRQDARVALYWLLGEEVFELLADEFDERSGEADDVARWWSTKVATFDPESVYHAGKLASPGVFIEEMKIAVDRAPDEVPSTLYRSLQDWTGQNFGGDDAYATIARWDVWWSEHSTEYQPGKRYFHAHLVP